MGILTGFALTVVKVGVIIFTIVMALLVLMLAVNSKRLKTEVEDCLWSDIKHVGPIPIPWHKYYITKDKIIEKKGSFVIKETETFIYLIIDVSKTENFIQRLAGVGNIILTTKDAEESVIVLHGIKNPKIIKESISNMIYKQRNSRPEVIVR